MTTQPPRGLLGLFRLLEAAEPEWRISLAYWLDRAGDSHILAAIGKPSTPRIIEAVEILTRLMAVPLDQVQGPSLRSFNGAVRNGNIGLLLTAYLGENPWALRAKLSSGSFYPETAGLLRLVTKPGLLGPSSRTLILQGSCISNEFGKELAQAIFATENLLITETRVRRSAEQTLATARQRLDLISETLYADLEAKPDSANPLPPILQGVRIEQLSLSVRTYNVLKKYDILTLDELVLLTGETLNDYRNFGRKGLVELRQVMAGMDVVAAFAKGQPNNWTNDEAYPD